MMSIIRIFHTVLVRESEIEHQLCMLLWFLSTLPGFLTIQNTGFVCAHMYIHTGLFHLINVIASLFCFHRGGMIQTAEQYQFVHHVLSLYERQLTWRPEE